MKQLSSLTFPEANRILQYIVSQATTAEVAAAICIVDVLGTQLCAASINGVAQHYISLAPAKARTALREGVDTIHLRYAYETDGYGDLWHLAKGRWTDLEVLHTAQFNPDFCGFAGGTLVVSDGLSVGAVGVAGLTEAGDHRPSEVDDHRLSALRPERWAD